MKRYKNARGQLHRVDGPAVSDTDGYQEWYFEGELHRLDGPAVVVPDGDTGDRYWFFHGIRHRADGPAVMYSNGICGWWWNGHRLDSMDEYCQVAGIEGKHKTLFLLKYSGVAA